MNHVLSALLVVPVFPAKSFLLSSETLRAVPRDAASLRISLIKKATLGSITSLCSFGFLSKIIDPDLSKILLITKGSTFFPPLANTEYAIAFLKGSRDAVPKDKDRSEGSLSLSNPNFSAYDLTLFTPNSRKSLTETRFLLCNNPSLSLVSPKNFPLAFLGLHFSSKTSSSKIIGASLIMDEGVKPLENAAA